MLIKRIFIMTQTTFQDCRVHFYAFFLTTFLEIAVYGLIDLQRQQFIVYLHSGGTPLIEVIDTKVIRIDRFADTAI